MQFLYSAYDDQQLACSACAISMIYQYPGFLILVGVSQIIAINAVIVPVTIYSPNEYGKWTVPDILPLMPMHQDPLFDVISDPVECKQRLIRPRKSHNEFAH